MAQTPVNPADIRAARRSASTAARRTATNTAGQVPEVAPLAQAALAPVEAENGAPAGSGSPEAPAPRVGQPPRSANLSAARLRREAQQQAERDAAGQSGYSNVNLTVSRPGEDLTRQIDQTDLIIPKLRLSQAMSQTNREYAASRGQSGVAMGSWYHSTTGKDLGQSVFFVPVDMRKSRAMFVQGSGLVCRSFDLLHGEGDPGILCEGTLEERHLYKVDERGCSMRLWVRDGDKNTPPPCGVSFNYPGFIITDIDNPDTSEIMQAMLQLRSTSTQAAKTINTHVMNYGEGVWANVILELGVTEKTNQKGTFYVPTAEFYDRTDSEGFDKIRRRAMSFARSVGSVDLRSSIEQDAEMESE